MRLQRRPARLPNFAAYWIDLLATRGLPLMITELDIDGPTDEVELAGYQRIFPIFWEHPAVIGVTLWGFRPGMWRTAEGATLVYGNDVEQPAFSWLIDDVRDSFALPDAGADGMPGAFEAD